MPLFSFVARLFRRFSRAEIPGYAAGLAYYTLFALFPLLSFAAGTAKLLGEGAGLHRLLLSLPLPEELSDLFLAYLSDLELVNGRGLYITSLVLSLYSCSRAARLLMNFFDRDESQRRSALRRLLLSLGFGAALLISIAVLLVLIVLGDLFPASPLLFLCRYVASGSLIFAFFILFHRLGPSRPQPGPLLPGALFFMVGILALSHLFSLYVAAFPNRGLLYGSFSAPILLLLWLHAGCSLMLISGEVNAELGEIWRQRREID